MNTLGLSWTSMEKLSFETVNIAKLLSNLCIQHKLEKVEEQEKQFDKHRENSISNHNQKNFIQYHREVRMWER